jgi:hypothetical protein
MASGYHLASRPARAAPSSRSKVALRTNAWGKSPAVGRLAYPFRAVKKISIVLDPRLVCLAAMRYARFRSAHTQALIDRTSVLWR